MISAETSSERDQIIVAISPSDASYATDGYCGSVYNPSLDNPYAVPDSSEKLNQAFENLDLEEYDLGENENWLRFDWKSVVDREPVQVEKDGLPHESVSRAQVAKRILDGLCEGFHYSVLAYNDSNEPVEVVWNYENTPEIDSRRDGFEDLLESRRHRQLAIEYQEQHDNTVSRVDTE
jgi:hypothetical protein